MKPAPQEVVLPRILGAPVVLRGYPMAMVHAEKIVTALSRGTANTRWRDFGDIYALAGRHGIDGDELISSLETVAGHRAVDLRPLGQVLAGYGELAQPRYRAWRTKHGRDDLPEQFQALLERTVVFADPALDRTAAGRRWDPITLAWR